jgi:hypothetical protein
MRGHGAQSRTLFPEWAAIPGPFSPSADGEKDRMRGHEARGRHLALILSFPQTGEGTWERFLPLCGLFR